MFTILIDDHISAVLSQLSVNAGNLENQLEKAAGDSYLQDVLGWIDAGHAFTSRTGRLRNSIVLRQLAGNQVVSAGNSKTLEKKLKFNPVRNNYAPFIEFGTRYITPLPYFYADAANRQRHIDQRVSQVVKQLVNAS